MNTVLLQKINKKCMEGSFIILFCANIYNTVMDEEFPKYEHENESLLSHILQNGPCLLFGAGIKSAGLALVYPLTWLDTGYLYYHNRFYKKHLIFNFRDSKEFHDYYYKN